MQTALASESASLNPRTHWLAGQAATCGQAPLLDARAGRASENLVSKSHCTWAAPQDKCHPQTIAVTASRADGLGLKVEVGDESSFEFGKDVCGVLLQYPATDGSLHNYKARPAAVLDEAGARGGLQSSLYL